MHTHITLPFVKKNNHVFHINGNRHFIVSTLLNISSSQQLKGERKQTGIHKNFETIDELKLTERTPKQQQQQQQKLHFETELGKRTNHLTWTKRNPSIAPRCLTAHQ